MIYLIMVWFNSRQSIAKTSPQHGQISPHVMEAVVIIMMSAVIILTVAAMIVSMMVAESQHVINKFQSITKMLS